MLVSIYLLSLLSCGSLSILLTRVNARNPSAFRLPDRDKRVVLLAHPFASGQFRRPP